MSGFRIDYKNKIFSKETVKLDDKSFENCEFRDCMIVLERGDTKITKCKFINCKLILKGNAYTVGKIINLFTKGHPLKVVEFDETGSFLPR